jgi:hypothetical protein
MTADAIAEQLRAAQSGRSEALPGDELDQWFAETVEYRHDPPRETDGFMTREDRRTAREAYTPPQGRTRTPLGDFEVVDDTIICSIAFAGPGAGDYRAVRFVYTVEGDKIVKLEESNLSSPG